MELIVGGKDGLQPVERTIIDRCARMVYRDFLNDPDNTPMPTLQNLYDLLCQQTEPEAKRLATALEIYVSGSSISSTTRPMWITETPVWCAST